CVLGLPYLYRLGPRRHLSVGDGALQLVAPCRRPSAQCRSVSGFLRGAGTDSGAGPVAAWVLPAAARRRERAWLGLATPVCGSSESVAHGTTRRRLAASSCPGWSDRRAFQIVASVVVETRRAHGRGWPEWEDPRR